MALPPFEPNEVIPEDDDLVSQYPGAARTFRDIIESWILVGHNNLGQHTAVALADLAAARPEGDDDVVTIWQEDGVIYVRNENLGTLYTIPYYLYDALVTGVPNSGLANMAVGTIKGRALGGVAGVPQDLTAAQAAAIVNSGGIPYAILQDRKPLDTQGGTFTLGAWRTRDLNHEAYDPQSIVTISANKFTLQPGTYMIKWSAPAFGVDGHVSSLWSTTLLIDGSCEMCSETAQTRSVGVGRVVLASATALSIEHRCETTRATSGFGTARLSVGLPVYTQVEIWKVG